MPARLLLEQVNSAGRIVLECCSFGFPDELLMVRLRHESEEEDGMQKSCSRPTLSGGTYYPITVDVQLTHLAEVLFTDFPIII